MSDRTAILATFFFGPLAIGLIFFGSSYILPFTGPSSASLAESGSIIIDTFINEEKIDLQWEVRLGSPQPFFQGIKEIILYAENDDYSMFIELPLLPIHEDSSASIWISSYNLLTQYASQAKDKDNPIVLDVDKYDSGMKSILLRTSIDLPETILQREADGINKDAPKSISLELHGQVEIDSGIYYEWSSKGGDTYRL